MKSLKIGLPATLSGRHAVQGRESFRGIRLFVDQTRARGGIKTREGTARRPELVFRDDSSLPEKTAENTRRLIERDRVDVLLGPYSSSLALACVEVAEKARRAVWNYGGSSDDIAASGYRKIVNTASPSSSYFHAVVDMAIGLRPRPRAVAILGVGENSFSRTVCEGARRHAERAGMEAAVSYFRSGTKDFSEMLSRAKELKTDCVLCCGRMEDDINLALWISENEAGSFTLVATLAAAVNEFGRRLGERSENFVSTSQWEPTFEAPVDFGPGSTEFSKEFADRYGYAPDYTAAQAYNIGVVIGNLIEKTSSTDEEVLLREALRSEFTTFYGDFRMDEKTLGQTGHRMLVTQWQNGQKKIVFPERHSDSTFSAVGAGTIKE